jgi:sec-independent protein translocase protein TatA
MGFLREPSHVLLILLVVVVLFGSRRLPDAAKGLGQAMRVFKAEVKQMADDDKPKRPEPSAEPGEPLEGRVIRTQTTQTTSERTGETPRNV